jgi:hypothetical protein
MPGLEFVWLRLGFRPVCCPLVLPHRGRRFHAYTLLLCMESGGRRQAPPDLIDCRGGHSVPRGVASSESVLLVARDALTVDNRGEAWYTTSSTWSSDRRPYWPSLSCPAGVGFSC